jgi:hypothetical protein
MNIAVAFSHKDTLIGGFWAKWLRALGPLPGAELYLAVTDMARTCPDMTDLDPLVEVFGLKGIHLSFYRGKDPGYPGGANRLFRFTMAAAAKAGKPILWTEPDAIPTRPGWYDELVEEYKEGGKPFCGPQMTGWAGDGHMNGTGIYPTNWQELAPSLASAPDSHPFDVYAGKEVAPHLFPSRRQVHRFGHGSREYHNACNIPEEAAIIHPCKDGSLIRVLNEKLGLLDPDEFRVRRKFYLIENLSWPGVRSTGVPVTPLPIISGSQQGIATSDDFRDQALLARHSREGAIKQIPEDEYKKYLFQVRK